MLTKKRQVTNLLKFNLDETSDIGFFLKDFTRPHYSYPIMDMSEFFIENPQYRVIKYIPIKDGIRCWYVVVS